MISVPLLKGKRVLVMGLGKSGTATARALLAAGAGVMAWDDGEAARKSGAEAGIPIRDPSLLPLDKADLLVWSPGIPHTHPQPHPLAEKARAANLPMVCDVELLAQALPGARMLAVTGTNGKSTTTTLLAHVLDECGLPVAAGGNLGTAALDLPELPGDGRYVLELSSYQLELTHSLKLGVAILLNVTPDHLGRHGGMAGYIAAKRRVFDFLTPGGAAVVGIDDGPCRAIVAELDRRGIRVVKISVDSVLAEGVSAPEGVLLDNAKPVCDLKTIPSLPGRHNWQNACAVYAAARAEGLSPKQIAQALATYPGLAHRQELVGEDHGIAWINDSKATNADAVEKALVCYDHVYWILGGQAKEGGIASLEKHFGRIQHAFLIGEATEAFAATLDGKVRFTRCATLDKAVAAARNLAVSDSIPGAVVLLSPACASWDQFTSFEHRGDTFRELVQAFDQGGAA
ncbi:UDP-N-acetylmuramoyl-L-alanine--D-glutamate ligase [Paramagnetospirillum magneticum]|uniref:UDP-N-acetylmuramoylalanine--D-glutamate ligase n=1 Tax=Paramagnetospirillum magneticum (strain ATCC 700264 / AMB-1) TaxID=342108 RepID=MURD_PARM1|nr:UDP-N-acetylmuramoyl-L-alanine--D-glutamate ligase [Paramagnetospirillum magneticum]Q2W0H5.1 RecName: Full=UDP-N-acetylmuramoylalanine--D-glutamate ligase; AltName: Full=D-glutamic acid-adding enzyme; AltName: Full=UDP-N-acetylmuramoyl-L-alanyl-D-glutamate synthetase [Paramagnetospirillum magneticum AMB-1]BAE52650.1 UDP-N-acetylmuramoylalanine-D-glutamate ligase [Paramagnetospirillum magneticum AMB-1]